MRPGEQKGYMGNTKSRERQIEGSKERTSKRLINKSIDRSMAETHSKLNTKLEKDF